MSEVPRRAVLAGSAAVVAAGVLTAATAGPATAGETGHGQGTKPTVVLVHGAFADASGWTEVIRRLTRDGYPVLAPPNPLRGVASDSAYLASFLATVPGPIVLVGHSYGGFVLTNAATGNANVKALVYVAAFAPDAGETVQGLQVLFPGTKLGEPQLDFRQHPGGYDGYVKAAVFREVFAGDLPRATTDLMWATQRPGDTHTLGEPSGAPAWRDVPSWYLVARDDQLIPAAAQRFMADRAGARVVEVRASHVAMISQPKVTADLIALAARTVAKGF
ncbi:pimeloyl-ACP methyl ester carboxylesterase [Catenuloplanes nepalensis]|uniref:Pimeloyl-ACP methyl ester carboxylesterase n=1 Tax=Catenuloplanes nepalensis TaxID=587533 RepID=A0ABT9MQP6_9ACTN|nr:alpha/beta hydrolase [Catenuloplanes nepalensis]MDP9793621.1 pimeloyl-ACP methyl ester carboxylesterase [Catenuloplanes nepalensis]